MTEANFDLGTLLPTIVARRVQLRWLVDDDVPALFAIFGDPQVTRYWGNPALADENGAAKLLADIHELFAQRRLFQWGIALIETNAVIGTCTLAALDSKNRRAELGFALGRAHWGCGYAGESLRALLSFAFSTMHLHRLTADTDPRNEASIRTLERLGFRREGYLREHHLTHDEAQDSIIYGLLRSDWKVGMSSK